MSSLLLLFLHSAWGFTLRASHHLCRFREPQVLFVPNIALCRGKRLNICTKLWGSFDFRFQLADPVVTLCFPLRHVLHSKCVSAVWGSYLLALTLVQSHPHNAGYLEAFKIFFFPLFGKAASFQSVGYFLSACLLENEFILLSHNDDTYAPAQFTMLYWSF